MIFRKIFYLDSCKMCRCELSPQQGDNAEKKFQTFFAVSSCLSRKKFKHISLRYCFIMNCSFQPIYKTIVQSSFKRRHHARLFPLFWLLVLRRLRVFMVIVLADFFQQPYFQKKSLNILSCELLPQPKNVSNISFRCPFLMNC